MAIGEVFNDENMKKWYSSAAMSDEGIIAVVYCIFSNVGAFISNGAFPGYCAITKKGRILCHYNTYVGLKDYAFMIDDITQINVKRGVLDALKVFITFSEGRKKHKIKFYTPKEMKPELFSQHVFEVRNLEEALKAIMQGKEADTVDSKEEGYKNIAAEEKKIPVNTMGEQKESQEKSTHSIDDRCVIRCVIEENGSLKKVYDKDNPRCYQLEKLKTKPNAENVAKSPVYISDVGIGGGERYVIGGSNGFSQVINMINESHRIRIIYGNEAVEGSYDGYDGERISIITPDKYIVECKIEGCDIEFLESHVFEKNEIDSIFLKIKKLGNVLEDNGIDFVKYKNPVTVGLINQWETSNGIKLPIEYKRLLLCTNGMKYGMSFFYPLEQIKKDEYQFKGYYMIGEFIGDGSLLLCDENANTFTGDHVYGINEKGIKEFLEEWFISPMEDDIKDNIG